VFDSAITQATEGLAVAGVSADNKRRLLAIRARAKFSKAIWAKLNGSGGAPASTPVTSPLVSDAGADADAAAALTEMGPNNDYKFKLTPLSQTLGFPNVGNDLNNRLELRAGDSQAGSPSSLCRDDTCDSWVVPGSGGNTVTATLTNAPGGASDWLALATVGSPATSYVQWTYVGAGATTRTWTVTLATPGTYEFRLFLNGGYTRAATSPAVTVSSGTPGSPTLTLSTTTVSVGGQVTTTLANGAGGAGDWLALAAVGSPDTSYLKWTNVGAGVTTRTWTVTLATPGSYEFRLFLNGGYTRAATSPVVAVPSPLLSVSATTIPVGGSVTVTLNGGTGGAADWLALAAAGAPNTSYVQWTYVGAGLTTRTWTVTLATPGSYEFRLFLNGGYTRAATSATVTAGP